jgi:adenylate cyclase
VFRQILAANFVGSALVFAYLEASAVPSQAKHRMGNWSDFAEFFGLAIVGFLLIRRGVRKLGETLDWLGDDRGPTDAERNAVLALPTRAATQIFLGWVAVALFAAAGNWWTHRAAAPALRIVVGIVLSGVTVAFLTALLVERALRPVFARALAGRVVDRTNVFGVRRRLFLFWALGSGVPLAGVLLTPVGLPPSQQARIIVSMLVLSAVGLASGCIFTLVAASSVAEPVTDVRQAMRRVASGELDVEVPVDDDGELGLLQAGFNHMAAGLRERERLRELFGGYVGEEVARRALESGVSLEGEERDISVLFVDVVGSTALAERRTPAEVVALLNRFFDAVVRVVDTEDGWVNKFEGDATLCVFGAPLPQPDHAARALRAALALRRSLQTIQGLDAGIGVSSGTAVAGNVGSARRYEYTVVGNPVNEAARLTEMAKIHAGRIVVSEHTVRSAGNGAGWKPGECVTLRGRTQPTQTFVPG